MKLEKEIPPPNYVSFPVSRSLQLKIKVHMWFFVRVYGSTKNL